MKFRSGLEKQVAELLKELSVKFEYESTKVPYELQCNYTPDFLLPNGIYLETKGQFTSEDRRKMLAVKKQHLSLIFGWCSKPLSTRSANARRPPMPNGAKRMASNGLLPLHPPRMADMIPYGTQGVLHGLLHGCTW